MTWLLGDTAVDPATDEGTALLAAAHGRKERLRCACTHPRPEMYIARAQGKFLVKRMPETGAEHAPDCPSWMPPEELSGLAQVHGSAIDESPEDGTTSLKLDFALSTRGKRAAPQPAGDTAPTEAKEAPRKLTLTSVLHYLWHEADLVKWVPRMQGKRWWGVIHNALIRAADNKIAKGHPITEKLFVPEPFKPELKAALAARRQTFFGQLAHPSSRTTPLGILIAEYKSHAETRLGARFTFKHMPDCPFFADADLHKRFEKVFEEKIRLADMIPGTHIMVIGTFSIAKAGYPVLHEIGMMLTTANWIPFEHMREHELIDALTEDKRSFTKSLRFNLPVATPIASMVLTDTTPPTAMFAATPGKETASDTALANAAEEGIYPAWLWLEGAEMPDLAAPGVQTQ